MVTCIVDGDVTTKPDENGVGAIVDATGTTESGCEFTAGIVKEGDIMTACDEGKG